MHKKFCFCLSAFAFGLVLLFGCTPYMKGSMQLDRENYDVAIESFQEELSQNPENWQARQRLGFAYLKTGHLDQAISEFKAVLGQKPGDYPYSTAFSYAPQKIKHMPGQKPGDPLSTYYLGLAYLQNGQRSESIDTWRSYRNKQEPLVEQEIKKQLTLVEIADSIHLARQALAEEEKLKALPPKPGTVAVFYFKDVSKDNSLRHLQKAMATMITTDLSQVKSLHVLERMRMQFLLTEMQLGQTGIVDEKTAPRAGRLLGAENLIVGTMEPRSLHFNTNVTSTSSKNVVGTIAVGAELEEFYILEKEIVYSLLKVLHVKFTPEEEKKFSQYHTKNLNAVVYFGQGLEALDIGKWKEAKNFFSQASEEDPSFKLTILYRDVCPAGTAPSISALSAMADDEMAIMVDSAFDSANVIQANIIESPPDRSDSLIEADTTGGVSVKW